MFTLFISVSSLLTLASETFAVNPPNKFAFAELYYTKELLLNVLLIRSTICCSLNVFIEYFTMGCYFSNCEDASRFPPDLLRN